MVCKAIAGTGVLLTYAFFGCYQAIWFCKEGLWQHASLKTRLVICPLEMVLSGYDSELLKALL